MHVARATTTAGTADRMQADRHTPVGCCPPGFSTRWRNGGTCSRWAGVPCQPCPLAPRLWPTGPVKSGSGLDITHGMPSPRALAVPGASTAAG